jgi:membrane associated rhomboid family serine protease
MIPLRDENPTHSTPIVTIVLIAINLVVFIYQLVTGLDLSAFRFGLIPTEFLGREVVAQSERMAALAELSRLNFDPPWATVFTSMFMHGSWMHIIGNMWFLWIFGNNIEDAMGKGKFIFFYLLSGVLAALAQVYTSPDSPIPMVGASGAVAGVLGAYLVCYPGSRVLCLITTFIITTIEVPAFIVLGMWFALQILNSVVQLGPRAPGGGGVAYAAHVGGFVAGLVLGRFLAGNPERRPPRNPYDDRPGFMDWQR